MNAFLAVCCLNLREINIWSPGKYFKLMPSVYTEHKKHFHVPDIKTARLKKD